MLMTTLNALITIATVVGFNDAKAMPVPPGMPPGAAPGASGDEKKPDFPPFDEVTKDMKVRDGFFTLYQDEKKDRLLVRVSKDKLGKPFLGATSISRGPVFSGWQWVDAPMYWDRHGKQLILMLAEPRYLKGKGTPVEDVIARTYMDSIVKAVPIVTETDGDPVIDLADLLKADIIQLADLFDGRVDRALSRFGDVKNFEKNTEISVDLAVKANPQGPPGRGMPQPGAIVEAQVVTVHYSFSYLPDPAKDDYQPRVADSRVGYFLTVVKDWTADHGDKSIFKRYINRWRLRKAEPDKEVSDVLPEDQIIFYVEKTVPIQYRQYVRDGILEWNRAFEKAGLRNAVVVRQQTDKNEYKDIDPEDIRYNFFRWIVSGQAYAMGPSRANPFTGQILDADIVFDDSMVRYLLQEFNVNSPRAALGGMSDVRMDEFLAHNEEWRYPLEKFGPSIEKPDMLSRLREAAEHHPWGHQHSAEFCELGVGMSRQISLAAYASAAAGQRNLPEEYIGQVIKEITAHEVGHTLGLRHNFKASSWQKLCDIKACKACDDRATTASVMDYNPSVFSPSTQDQGVFVTTTIGPYDYWAIEYGYRPFAGGKGPGKGGPQAPTKEPKGDVAAKDGKDAAPAKSPGTNGTSANPATPDDAKPAGDAKSAEAKKDTGPASEAEMLKSIASRSAEPGLAYATDEDTFFAAPDPTSNRFDNGSCPVEWSKDRIASLERLWKDGLDWAVKDGENWNRARRAFDMMLGEYGYVAFMSARVVGGQYINRDHKGDPNARPPVQPVPADKQREALKFLADKVWSDSAFAFSPKLLNHLGPGRWLHWDSDALDFQVEFDVHDRVRGIQWLTLFQTMNPFTLNRVYDSQRLVPESQDAVTVPELLGTVTRCVWTELDRKPDGNYTNRSPFVSSYRRSLQRDHLQFLSDMVASRGRTGLYADVHSVARLTLKNLGNGIDKTLKDNGSRLDDFSRAHLTDSRQRINKALEAEFSANARRADGAQVIRIGQE